MTIIKKIWLAVITGAVIEWLLTLLTNYIMYKINLYYTHFYQTQGDKLPSYQSTLNAYNMVQAKLYPYLVATKFLGILLPILGCYITIAVYKKLNKE